MGDPRAVTHPAIQATAWLALLVSSAAVGCESQEEYRLRVARDVFDRNCSECHGVGASEPRYVEEFGAKAPDLRRLWSRYGTPLPRERLAEFIDGRADVAAHGPREMPVWGRELYKELPDNKSVREMRAGTIDLLLDFIESVQTEGSEPGPSPS